MTRIDAIRFARTGPPEVLRLESRDLPPPAPHEIQIRHRAIGVNYIDTYHRSGAYPVTLPSGLGVEAAGTVSAVGSEVEDFTIGDRAGYATGPLGAYATAANVPADQVLHLPGTLTDLQAAGFLLKGMTAYYLLHQTYPVKAGETILVHAAAGGVGQLLCQWASSLGARVIGTVGSPAKADLARAAGCDDVILYKEQDFADAVRALTAGAGVQVVYDSVGAATVAKSLDCLARRGMLVSFGNASGPPPALEFSRLAAGGSLFTTRPSLFDYVATAEELRRAGQALFEALARGALTAPEPTPYPLKDAARAHTDLEARKTTGSLVLIP